MTNLKELRRVAEATINGKPEDSLMPFLNAFTPETCLELLDLIDEMAGASSRVMNLLEKHGAGIVPHLLDTDENAGQFLREALAKYNELKGE